MRIPLLATLTIMVFRQTGKLPENRPRLYDIFTDLLSGGWDLAKGIIRTERFVQKVKGTLLSALASKLHELRRREFDDDDIRMVIKSTLPVMGKEWKMLRDELVIDGLINRSGNILQFPHLSFQEFLTAKDYLSSPQPVRANHALEEFLHGDDWWKEVLNFYIGLSTSPLEIINWFGHQFKRIIVTTNYKISALHTRNVLEGFLEAFPVFSMHETITRIASVNQDQSASKFLKEYLKDATAK